MEAKAADGTKSDENEKETTSSKMFVDAKEAKGNQRKFGCRLSGILSVVVVV